MTVEGEWTGEQFEPRPAKEKPRKKRKDLPPEAAEAPIFSDEYLALRFAGEHADDLRYVAAWGKWFAGIAAASGDDEVQPRGGGQGGGDVPASQQSAKPKPQ